jgi:hypothetical protein
VVALFAELEAVPRRDRESQDYRDKTRQLARSLGLMPEWWTGNHVNDRSRAPCHPPEYLAHHDWHVVRGMRERLLEAAKSS